MPQAVLGGTPCTWAETGEGPPVLFLHCMLSRGLSWMRLARLMDNRTCVMPDMVGHGDTGPHDPERDLQDQSLAMIRALAKRYATSAGGPIEVIGHSFGGTLALRLAVEAPKLVSRLTLIEPVYFAAADKASLEGYMNGGAPFIPALQEGDTDRALSLFLEHWGSEAVGDLPDAQRAYLRDRMPLVALSDASTVRDAAQVIPRLSAIECPVLLVEGSASPPIVRAIQNGLAMRLPQSSRVVIAGAGHDLVRTHTAALYAELGVHSSIT